MIRKIRDKEINAITKEAITELEDSFGHRHIVQTRLLSPGTDHAKEVDRAEAMLAANEQSFVDKLKAPPFNMTDEQIAELRIR